MYVSELIPSKNEVIQRALASPKIKPNSELEFKMRIVFDTVAAKAKEELEYTINIDVNDAVAVYEVNNGKYDALPADENLPRRQSEYGDGLDNAIEALLEPYIQYLSADWLGRATIGTDLWIDGAISSFAKSAAAEIWKQLTHGKTPAQVLASAGIVAADITNFNTGDTTMADALDLDGVLAKIKKHVGKDYDRLSVYDDLDMVCNEDDEILCNAAGARIGLNPTDIETLQIAALGMADPADDLAAMLEAVKLETAKATATRAKADKAATKDANSISAEVFKAMKECGVGDTAMAEALGVSRSTYINYINGKTVFVPEGEQKALIRLEIVTRLNKLAVALAELDGAEPWAVV